MSFLRHGEIYRPMSFRLAIPWRVALPQSPPPLYQTGAHLAANGLSGTIETQRTANSALTVCLTPGDNPNSTPRNPFVSV